MNRLMEFFVTWMAGTYILCIIVFVATAIESGTVWWEAVLVGLYWPVAVMVIVIGEHVL